MLVVDVACTVSWEEQSSGRRLIESVWSSYAC